MVGTQQNIQLYFGKNVVNYLFNMSILQVKIIFKKINKKTVLETKCIDCNISNTVIFF